MGWTAGLGTDFNKAQVLTGLSFTIYSNLQIAAGAAFREEKVPTGLHAIGDTVKMNLTEAQLQVDAFRVRPFLSISLRFDRNPFKKDGDEPAEETKPETKPDPRKAPTPTDTTKNTTLSNSSSTR